MHNWLLLFFAPATVAAKNAPLLITLEKMSQPRQVVPEHWITLTYGGLIQDCKYPWCVKMELLTTGTEAMFSSHQSLHITTNSVWTCATWSWMPPSAIMRSVCRAIRRASTPSEVEQFIHQYDMRNIRFTVEWHKESDKDYGVTSLLWFQLSLPGDGNLGASLKPPYSSS